MLPMPAHPHWKVLVQPKGIDRDDGVDLLVLDHLGETEIVKRFCFISLEESLSI